MLVSREQTVLYMKEPCLFQGTDTLKEPCLCQETDSALAEGSTVLSLKGACGVKGQIVL